MPLQLTITGKIRRIDVEGGEKISFMLCENKRSIFKFVRIVCKFSAINENLLKHLVVGAVVSATGDFFKFSNFIEDDGSEKQCVNLYYPRLLTLVEFAPFEEKEKSNEGEEQILGQLEEALKETEANPASIGMPQLEQQTLIDIPF